MKIKTELWIKALIASTVTGAASTGLSALGIATANGLGANVPQLDLKQLGVMLLSGGIVGLLAYLKQSPVPPDDDAPASKLPLVLLIGALALGGPVVLAGCVTQQQTIAYKTLFSVEKLTSGAYDGYIDSVIAGQSTTNGVPRVSKAFNKFQGSFAIALDAVQFNTNALAPASLVIESGDVVNLINQFKGK